MIVRGAPLPFIQLDDVARSLGPADPGHVLEPKEGGWAGHEFALSVDSGLWLPATGVFRASDWANWTGTLTLNSQPIGLLNSWIASYSREPPKPPATASPLWDNPETVTEEIIAYRAWDYRLVLGKDGHSVVLESVTQRTRWEGPVLTADEVPTAENYNGIHALSLNEHSESLFGGYVGDAIVWGTVTLSGVVVEGKSGYRAERATIKELWVDPEGWDDEDNGDVEDWDAFCRLLAERYQCDVTIRKPDWDELRG